MLRFGDQDAGEALLADVRAAVEELQLVDPLQVEGETSFAAENLHAQGVLSAKGNAGDFDTGHSSACQRKHGPSSIVDSDWFGSVRPRTRWDVGVQPSGDVGDCVVEQVLDLIDDMRGDVSQRTGTCGFLAQSPRHG